MEESVEDRGLFLFFIFFLLLLSVKGDAMLFSLVFQISISDTGSWGRGFLAQKGSPLEMHGNSTTSRTSVVTDLSPDAGKLRKKKNPGKKFS